MNLLRRIHLYLGCIFAPLLIFFAISGIWQTLGLQWGKNNLQDKNNLRSALQLLSTLHTSRGLKRGGIANLSTPILKYIIIAMAVSLVLTIILGVIMAFKFGHQKIAAICLIVGFLTPVLIIILHCV